MSRNYRTDVLKAVAILAVVFYHFGGVPNIRLFRC